MGSVGGMNVLRLLRNTKNVKMLTYMKKWKGEESNTALICSSHYGNKSNNEGQGYNTADKVLWLHEAELGSFPSIP